MAISNGYTTLAILKAWLDISDTDDDTELELAIEAASRWIDQWLGKRRGITQFYEIAAEVRYFDAHEPTRLAIPDFTSISEIATDEDGDATYETVWASTDFDTWPYNASATGEPFEQLETTHNGDEYFPVGVRKGVKITATWGYNTGVSTAAPPQVQQACLILSARLWKRRDAIFGVAGAPALGVQTVTAQITADNDVITLLNNAIPARNY